MNSENIKTFYPYRLVINLTYEVYLRRGNKRVLLSHRNKKLKTSEQQGVANLDYLLKLDQFHIFKYFKLYQILDYLKYIVKKP